MLKDVLVPDLGNFSNVPIIEILVKEGDKISVDASLITVETDKATMEVPSPFAGIVKSLKVKMGDKVSSGDLILTIEVAELNADIKKEVSETKSPEPKKEIPKEVSKATATVNPLPIIAPVPTTTGPIHAGPGTRRMARELGVDLSRVSGTGLKNRITKTDVQHYVKAVMQQVQSGSFGSAGVGGGIPGLNLPPWPEIDYAQYGPIDAQPLSRIKKLSGGYLHRNWVMVPHVTHFDEADITEMEKFRKDYSSLAEEQKVKLTPLVFIMKAVVSALKAYPNFNASLDPKNNQLIIKHYFHFGIAVDTPQGLVVPVVKDVDKKGLFQLAKELGEISETARQLKLKPDAMQGSSFSISSLGGIGGTAFTPIVNVPDVAILGVSRAQWKPVWINNEFKPRLMVPLSLSYDHRVIDGAEAARFSSYLSKQLSDIRRLLL